MGSQMFCNSVRIVALLLFAGMSNVAISADTYVNGLLPWHSVVLDSQGKLLSWYYPERNLGYDHLLRQGWDFLKHKVPIDEQSGELVYLTNSTFDPKTLQGSGYRTNPASTFAHQLDALLGWYPYSGDAQAIDVVRRMLDYMLAHGTTPADWAWSGVPFSTSCGHDKTYGRCLAGMPEEFGEGLETDKVAEMGLAYVRFYELTGERRYLEAGIRCANALAKHQVNGDAYHTPWPYRVNARTGATLNGEVFGGLVVASVSLFDELMRIGEGQVVSYKMPRDKAWNWLLQYPLNARSAAYDKWTGYYEDIAKDPLNINDMNSMMTARYIMLQADPSSMDPNWEEHVGHLIDFSRAVLGRGPFFGAWAIDEQQRLDGGISRVAEDAIFAPPGGILPYVRGRGCCSRAGLICRTTQWAAINAMYFSWSRDAQSKEDAFRSLNYATYYDGGEGKIYCCGKLQKNPLWFEDGYGDALRNFMWAMAAIPEFAPLNQDHLLGSTSVVQRIEYSTNSVQYRTFDKSSTEVLRLSFDPKSVTVGGAPLRRTDSADANSYWAVPLQGGDFEVHVSHVNGNEVAIRGR